MDDPSEDNGNTASPSTLQAAGSGADNDFSDQPGRGPLQECKKKTWVGIELLDSKGKPVPGKPYRVELPDGRVVEGALDQMGTAGVSGIDPGNCKITFPNLDARSWKWA
jgi:hypothetical protein